jgi:hypothetical protein
MRFVEKAERAITISAPASWACCFNSPCTCDTNAIIAVFEPSSFSFAIKLDRIHRIDIQIENHQQRFLGRGGERIFLGFHELRRKSVSLGSIGDFYGEQQVHDDGEDSPAS